ncbi:phage GP46 family protein [Desulfovibrio sp. SGI.169]|uniref:phage GP46 family protein n=1 Tax=Desulfovibrio sp. SGI.169 TaxID=3420561 RepID=UPI003D082A36
MDTQIDPATGDYTGARIDHLGNAVYLRLMTPRGSWWADTTLGSRLHELARVKDKARVSVLARQYAEQALQPLLDDGRARAIEVTARQPHNGRCLLHVEVTEAGGAAYGFDHFVRVGG